METNQAQQIHLTQSFAAGKEALYKAWTEEAELKQWWHPMDKQLASVENDIRPGGTVRYTFENGLEIHGTYKEAQPAEKLVYSWVWEMPEDSVHKGEYLLTIRFRGSDGESELDVLQENFKSEHAVKPHQEGWEDALQKLKGHLEAKNSNP